MAFWKAAWENDKLPWHKTELNSILFNNLLKITNNQACAKLFIPFCGKAVDMLELGKRGHKVVGVENSKKGVQQFFHENNLSVSTTQLPEIDGILFENEETNIKIYCCDFFKFGPSLEKDFDGVWDRGGLSSVDIDERERYINIMKSVCNAGTGYLLETADRPEGEGPPFFVSTSDMAGMFGLSSRPEEVNFEEGDFDGVWDHGGLGSLKIDERERYINIMKSVCKADASYLLETADMPEVKGPPFFMSTCDSHVIWLACLD